MAPKKKKKAKNLTNRQIRKANRTASNLVAKGSALGKTLLPEVFEGGSGLDRVGFQPIKPGTMNFADINQYIQPSVQDAIARRDDTTGRYDELVNLRRDKLGGLDAAENQALKESLFRDIDRQKTGALRDVARTPGLGAGASFGQRRALSRDYGNQALQANRQLLLDNVNLKRQALTDFEGTTGARQSALTQADQSLAGLRGLQGQAAQNVGQFNITNAMGADQFNANTQLAAQQFNAGQQGKELASKIGAISSGTGLIGDERDRIIAEREKKKMMEFLNQRDQQMFSQAQSMFG